MAAGDYDRVQMKEVLNGKTWIGAMDNLQYYGET